MVDPHSPDDDALESQLVQLTRDLVLIESTDSKPEERRRCFQLVRNHLEALPNQKLQSFESHGYESLVVLPKRVTTPTLLFCGHLDVVEHLGPEYYRSKIENGRIFGPGAGDMKGALSILLILYRNLLSKHPTLPIGLAITSDEERGGEHGARFLVDEVGLRAGAVVIPDGGSIDRVTHEEKGILHARVTVRGRSAHAARPWQGENALHTLFAGIDKLRQAFPEQAKSPGQSAASDDDHWYPTCSVTRLETPNESVNRIPEEAIADFDIRFPPPHTARSMIAQVREALGDTAEVTTIISAEPTHLDPDPGYLDDTEAVIGRPARLSRVSGGSDARFFRQHGIPVMLSRPNVGNLHGHDEWIDIRSMVDFYRICERYATRLA